MPLATTAAQNAALDAVVGTFPSPGTYRLYSDTAATSELPSGGGTAVAWAVTTTAGVVVYYDLLPQPKALTAYTSAPHLATDWAPAADGSKATLSPISIGDGFHPVLFFRNDI